MVEKDDNSRWQTFWQEMDIQIFNVPCLRLRPSVRLLVFLGRRQFAWAFLAYIR